MMPNAEPATRSSWLESGVTWLYTHHRRRYIWILVAVTAISVECIVPALAVAIAPVFAEDSSDTPRVLAVLWSASLLGIPTLCWLVRTHHGTALRYLRGDQPAPSADDVWISSVAELAKGVSACLAGYWVPFTAGAFVLAHQLDTPISSLLISIYAVAVSCGLVGVFFFLVWEAALRPLARELAPQLSSNILLHKRGPSISTKLFVLLVLTSLFNGFIVGSVALIPASYEARATVSTLVSIAVSIALAASVIWLLRRSFVSRVDEIRQALDRVEGGAREGIDLPPLAGDDLDDVTRAFNAMTRQLKQGEDDIRLSRTRIVAAADESRKRIERNIHDGAQQRLVALVLDLRMLEDQVSALSPEELVSALHQTGDSLKAALAELRELARGLHPSVLTTDGLGPAIEQLASRSSIPVSIGVTQTRFPEAVETACYFTVAEALANVAKYANASEAAVVIEQQDGRLRLQVRDNGVGGADPKAGSGLTGLVDRIAALDGTLTVDSPSAVGTTLTVELPLDAKASK
jgi:signal transduction histidine kinase